MNLNNIISSLEDKFKKLDEVQLGNYGKKELRSFPNKTTAYIASPFFNENSINTVKSLELILNSAEFNVYSPRKSNLDVMKSEFFEDKDLELRLKRKICFIKNIDILRNCNFVVVNLKDGYDIGTLFEYGYALYKSIDDDVFTITGEDKSLDSKVIRERIQNTRQSVIDGDPLDDKDDKGVSKLILGSKVYIKFNTDEYPSDLDAVVGSIIKTKVLRRYSRYESQNYMTGAIVGSETNKNWKAEIIMLGYIYGILSDGLYFETDPTEDLIYISTHVSKSNLMLTEAVTQYKSIDDLVANNPVNYKNEDIR